MIRATHCATLNLPVALRSALRTGIEVGGMPRRLTQSCPCRVQEERGCRRGPCLLTINYECDDRRAGGRNDPCEPAVQEGGLRAVTSICCKNPDVDSKESDPRGPCRLRVGIRDSGTKRRNHR